MKILAQYTLGYRDPTWIVVDSDLFDVREDVIKGLMSRLEEEYNRVNSGWGKFPHSRQLAIRNNLKVLQVITESPCKSQTALLHSQPRFQPPKGGFTLPRNPVKTRSSNQSTQT